MGQGKAGRSGYGNRQNPVFDFLAPKLDPIGGHSIRLHCCTVPGRIFYNNSRKQILKGVDGIILVADSQAPMLSANLKSYENLCSNLADHGYDLKELPLVLHNKRDLQKILPVKQLSEALNPDGRPEFEAVAFKGEGVLETVSGAG